MKGKNKLKKTVFQPIVVNNKPKTWQEILLDEKSTKKELVEATKLAGIYEKGLEKLSKKKIIEALDLERQRIETEAEDKALSELEKAEKEVEEYKQENIDEDEKDV